MEKYYYEGYLRCASVCGYRRNGDIVLLTELDENEGTSITNACTIIATELAEKFCIKPESLTIIEEYPTAGKLSRYSKANLISDLHWFDHRYVDFKCPSYEPLDENSVISMMGE